MRRRMLRDSAALATAAIVILTGCTATQGSGTERTNLVVATSWSDELAQYRDCSADRLECAPIFEPLVRMESSVNWVAEPWLAESFEWNEDQTVFSVTLRDDIEFSDGEKLTAEVAKANWEYLLDVWADGWARGAWFPDLQEVVVTGEYTFDVKLAKPDTSFLNKITVLPVMISPAGLADPDSLNTNPVGTGPYLLEERSATTATYTRNPDYWNPDAYPFDTVEVKGILDSTARLNAVISGQVDFAEIDASAAAQAEETGLQILTVGTVTPGLLIRDRNGETTPALGDIRVRQAISMAFDRQAMVDTILAGYGKPTTQPWTERWPEYDPEFDDQFTYDPDAARALLAEAGYPDGFELRMPAIAGEAQWQPIVEQSLADIGVTVEWDPIPDAQAFEAVGSKDYSVMIASPAPGSVILDIMSSIGSANPFKWQEDHPVIGPLLAELGTDYSNTELHEEFGQAVFEEAVIIVFCQKYTTYAAADGITLDAVDNWYRSLIEIQRAE